MAKDKLDGVVFVVSAIKDTKNLQFVQANAKSVKYNAILEALGKLCVGQGIEVPLPAGVPRPNFMNNLTAAMRRVSAPKGAAFRKGGLANGNIGIKCVPLSEAGAQRGRPKKK